MVSSYLQKKICHSQLQVNISFRLHTLNVINKPSLIIGKYFIAKKKQIVSKSIEALVMLF